MSLSIRAELIGISVLALMGFIIIGGIYTYSQNVANIASMEDARITGINLTVEKLNSGLLQARRNEKDFLLRGDLKYVDQHQESMEINYANIENLESLGKEQEIKHLVGSLKKLYESYENGFVRMAAIKQEVGLDENKGLLGALRNAVHGVEEKLKKFDQIYLTSSMLMMRRHEKDFLARGADKYLDRMAKEREVFSQLLKKTNLSNSERTDINQLMDIYYDGFKKLAAGLAEVKREIAKFREDAHAIDPELDSLRELSEKLSEINYKYQADTSSIISASMNITLLLVGGLVTVVLFMIGRGISRSLSLAVEAINEMTENYDLTRRLEQKGNDEISKLVGAMNQFVRKVESVIVNVKGTIDSVKSGSDQISEGNVSLSQRTEEQASSLEETASSMEEMNSTVKRNAEFAREANQLASQASVEAQKGGDVISKTMAAMEEINESSASISNIIATIDAIAFQTNLLALNAAVEAARAGDQGRGFAVVASEVRTLAQRSADAAKEIKDLIERSQGKVKAGAELVNGANETLTSIVDSTNKVTDIVSEISAASVEQASGVDQVNRAVVQIDDMTQQNAALVEEAAASSRSIRDQVINLDETIAIFTVGKSDPVANQQSQTSNQYVPARQVSKMQPPPERSQTELRIEKAVKATAGSKKTGTDSQDWEEF